jgi:hypothetical protein
MEKSPESPSTEEIEAGLKSLEDNFEEHQYNADKESAKLTDSLKAELRREAKTNLFFLATGILGYDRLSTNLHGHLCTWLKKNENEKYLEVLLPRAHFKSTIVTISRTIQQVLPDDVGDQPYPSNLGPNARILIVHEVAKMASGYLYSIIQHFMSNPLLMALFPEIVPQPRKNKINSTELVLPRNKIWNEPTIGILGVGGRSQGLHYDHLVLDDLIGEEARDSETVMQSAKLWFDSLPGFFVKLRDSKFTVVGTRWGPEDLYDHIEDRYERKIKVYRRAVEEPTGKKLSDGKPELATIFPEEVGPEDLEVLKKNPVVFSAQYLNDPGGGNTKFEEGWIKRFDWQNDRTTVAVFDSPRFMRKYWHVGDLNKVLICDPATSGNSGLVLVGTDAYSRHFVLEAQMLALSPPQLVQKFFDYYNRYKFRALVIEEVLFSELFRHWLEAEFKLRGTRFHIIPVKTKQQSKEARTLSLTGPMSAGTMYFNEDLYSRGQDRTGIRSDLIYQIIKFGNIKEYHILDALAYLPETASPAISQEDRSRQQESEKTLLAQRSASTGYSKIRLRER